MTAAEFQRYYGILPEPMLLVSASGRILAANEAAGTLLNRKTMELPGTALGALVSDPPEKVASLLSLFARNGEFMPGALAFKSSPSGSVNCRVEGALVPDVGTSAILLRLHQREGAVAQFRLLNERIAHLNQQLFDRQQAARAASTLSAIVDSCDDAIISKDLNGVITTWNPGARRLFGYTEEEAVGKSITMLIPADRLDEEPLILERLRGGERVDHFETIRKRKDGSLVDISLTISPVRDQDGRIAGASKVARDITERRRVVELQERLAAIVEFSDDAIISSNLDGTILSWNRGAEELFGYKADEAVGQDISVIAAPDRVGEIPEDLERIRRGERVEPYETKRKTKSGKILTVALTVSPVRNAAGTVIGASKVARDVTERVRQEEALQTANAALLRANEDLQQFAYSASHDLQEPLRMVAVYSELLQQRFGSALGQTGDDYIRYIVQGALRMESLLRDLRAYTQASTMDQEAADETDAGAVLAKALLNLESAISESGAEVSVTALPALHVHGFQLEQVFQNLISNAIRYRNSEPPRIKIAAERRGAEWVLSVEDNGIGIEPQFKEQVFGIFKRLHSVHDYPGTGMGLAICQRIVERAGGRIWVESEPGQGSTFFFTVPCGDGE